jgi:hypothetical protein
VFKIIVELEFEEVEEFATLLIFNWNDDLQDDDNPAFFPYSVCIFHTNKISKISGYLPKQVFYVLRRRLWKDDFIEFLYK